MIHAFWNCGVAEYVWSLGCHKLQKMSGWGLDFLSLMEHMSTILDANKFSEVAIIVRRIWLRRNAVIYENSFIHPTVLICQARKQLQEFGLV